MDAEIVVGYFVIGTIWGATNAYMEVGSKTEDQGETKENKTQLSNQVVEGVTMFTRLKFLVPFLLNQAASILNNFIVAKSDLSIAVPVVNCITFIVTFITMRLIKGDSLVDFRFFAGSVLIMLGLYLCLNK